MQLGVTATLSPPHPITLQSHHPDSASPCRPTRCCQPVTPSRLLPQVDVTGSQSSPMPSLRGSRWADSNVLPTSAASPAPLPAVPQPKLCRSALLPTPATSAPWVLGSFGPPAAPPSCSELDGRPAARVLAQHLQNPHLSAGTLPSALPPHPARSRHPGPVLHPSNTH